MDPERLRLPREWRDFVRESGPAPRAAPTATARPVASRLACAGRGAGRR
jgi:hypothetical protein